MTLPVLFLLFFLIPNTFSIKVNDCETVLINNIGLFITCPWTKIPQHLSLIPFLVKNLTSTIQFSLGNSHLANCDNSQMIWSTMDKNLDTCKNIAIKDQTFELLNKREPYQGEKTIFPNQTIGNNIYQLNVTLICDHNITNPLKTNFQLTKFLTNPLFNHIGIEIEGSSSLGCPIVSLGSFYQAFANYTLLLLLLVAFFCLIMCVWGFEIFKTVSFVLITILTTILIGALIINFATFGDNARGFFPSLTFSFIGGIFLGLFVFKFVSFAYFAMGSIIGVIVGTIIYQALIAPIIKDFAGTAPILIIIIFFGLIGGYIFLIFHRYF